MNNASLKSMASEGGRSYLFFVFVFLLLFSSAAFALSLPSYTARTIPHPEPQAGALFGSSLARINEDLNSDAITEILIGAPMQNSGQGKAYVYSGLDGTLLHAIVPPTGTAASTGGNFGIRSVSSGYDLDGGGKFDFVITAPMDTVNALAGAGRVHIYKGEDYAIFRTLRSPVPQANEKFGFRISRGDINGDSIPELAISAPGYNNGQGRIYIFNQSNGAKMLAIDDPSPQASSNFGQSRALFDINGDGKAEIIAANYNKNFGAMAKVGVVYIFDSTGALILTINHPEPAANANFGNAIAGISDQNRDGKNDLVISAPGQNGVGRLYIVSGITGALIRTIDMPAGEAEAGALFGHHMFRVDDLNIDSFTDLAVGSPGKTVNSTAGVGKIYYLSGRSGQLFDDNIMPPEVEAGMKLGYMVTSLNYQSGFAASAPNKDVSGIADAGTVYLFTSKPSASFVGTWGGSLMQHNNGTGGGSWSAMSIKPVFGADGTLKMDYVSGGQTVTAQTYNAGYSNYLNKNGSLALLMEDARGGMSRIKFGCADDKRLCIADGAGYSGSPQMIFSTIKLAPSKIYSNTDLKGNYYFVGYQVESSGGPADMYRATSGVLNAGGNGTYSLTERQNSNGAVTSLSQTGTYVVNPDGSIRWDGQSTGTSFLTGDGKLAVLTDVQAGNNATTYFLMKKADRAYYTADLAGIWSVSSIGDEGGTNFFASFGTMSCESNGKCAVSIRAQSDGAVQYKSFGIAPLSVAPDGSFGASLAAGAPAYSGAIGNAGNTIIMNLSYDAANPAHRQIITGARCSACSNLAENMIPMMSIASGANSNGLNIHLYKPLPEVISTVKQNTNDSWFPSLNMQQGLLVFSEGVTQDAAHAINVYDISAKTVAAMPSVSTKNAAYFNRQGQIIYLDPATGKIMALNPDLSTAVIASPIAPYTFSAFWLSPDRAKIVAVENKQTGDYYTTNYERLILMSSDGSSRQILQPQYLGEWNYLTWKPDSSGLLYYYHTFTVVGGVFQGKVQKYVLYNNIETATPSALNLSNSFMGKKDENICLFTASGNLLSISYRELYNGKTGALLKNVSTTVPDIMLSMFGINENGEIYFADADGTNFRRFIEPSYKVTVTKAGTASGTVTGAGINCGTDCSNNYAAGSTVELFAKPAAGAVFAGWSGACTGAGSCKLSLFSNKTVTATFNK